MRALFFIDYRLSKIFSTIDYRLSDSHWALYIASPRCSPLPRHRCNISPRQRCNAAMLQYINAAPLYHGKTPALHSIYADTMRRFSSIQARTSVKTVRSISCKGYRKSVLKRKIKPFPASCIFAYAGPGKGHKKTALVGRAIWYFW